jgi:hypothetical protein
MSITLPIFAARDSDLNIKKSIITAQIKMRDPKMVELNKPGVNDVEKESEIKPKIGIK